MRVVYREGDQPASEGTSCTAAEGKTRQSDADAADVNAILARAMRGVQPLAPAPDEVRYADVSGITDFRDAMDRVTRANAAFMQLDAKVRKEFENDPALFLDAFQSVEGVKKLDALGVVKIRDPEGEVNAAEAAVEARAEARRVIRERVARVKAAEGEPTK